MSSASAAASGHPAAVTDPTHQPFRVQATAGHSPSSPQKRPSHKEPETEQAITAHLLKSSALSDIRIKPRVRPDTSGRSPSPMVSPPSGGTRLKASVKEESGSADSSEGDLLDSSQTKQSQCVRRMSKLDQVLGDGAETARVLLASERRKLGEAVENGLSNT